MHRFLRKAAAAAAGLLVLTGTAAAAPPQLTATATFNGPQNPNNIVEHLVKMIDGAKKGSRILAANMIFDEQQVIFALLKAARTKNVQVTVLYDKITQQSLLLDGELRKVGNGSRGHNCRHKDDKGSCMGVNRMHSKFFLFEETLGEKHVVSVGTSNLNDKSVRKQYNSWYTEPNNKGLYGYYYKYWHDLIGEVLTPNYYDLQPPREFNGIKAYFYPRDEGDTMVSTLREVRCDGKTKIRIAHWSFSRVPVADELRRLANSGCQIEIITSRFAKPACERIIDQPNVRVWGFEVDGIYNHSKDMMIEGHYLKPGQKVVWTGSQNLNNTSLRKNDETVIRILNRSGAYDAYVRNFEVVQKGAEKRELDDCGWKEIKD